MKRLFFLIMIMIIPIMSGCVSVPKGSTQISSIETGQIVSGQKVTIAKAECLLEKNKIPIPSAVASVQNCGSGEATDAFSGFAQGFCNGQNQARQAKANSIRDKALAERREVYNACLLLKGYREVWVAYEKSPLSLNPSNHPEKKQKVGINFTDLTIEERRTLGRNTGVKIVNVTMDSPAYYADILVGDYLISIDGQLIANVGKAMEWLETVDWSNRSKSLLTIIRDGQEKNIEVSFLNDGEEAQEVLLKDEVVSSEASTSNDFEKVRCKSNPDVCLQKAVKVCDESEYKVVNSWSNAGGLFADLIPGPYTWYHMEIVCGLTDDQQPAFEFRG